MKTATTIAAAGVAAAVAVALIIAAVYIPGSNILGSRSSTGSTTSGTSSGSFSVMMTDPPTVPANVTDVYMTYNKVGVHISGDSNDSGWQILSQSGTIDLMQAINVSQTIATANLQAGETFDALGFNISQVVVTYQASASDAQNYTALLVYGQNRFFVPIPGGVTVDSSNPQAVLIDMTPRVIMLGSASNISFAFMPSARGYVIPSAEVSAQSHWFVGERESLEGNAWWKSVLENTSYGISGVVLAQNGLSITVKNTGSDSIVFHYVAVTGETSEFGGHMPLPAVSDLFVVESNATLAQLNTSSNDAAESEVLAGGYLLAPGQSVTFTYSGSVSIGMQSEFALNAHPLVPGDHYIVRLFGNGFVAAAATTAVQSMTG